MRGNRGLSRYSGLVHAAGLAACLLLPGSSLPAIEESLVFLRSDANGDGRVSLSDAMLVILWQFTELPPLPCADAADVDDSGAVDIADGVKILVAVFDGGLVSKPFPIPGPDPSDDDLFCERYDPEAPAPVDDLLRLEGAAAVPGERVMLPLRLSSAVEVDGLHLVLRHDAALFEPEPSDGGASDLRAFIEGTALERLLPARDPTFPAYLRVRVFPEDGIFQIGFIPHLLGIYTIPPGDDTRVGNLIGKVSADAVPGTRIEISFARHDRGPLPIETELSHGGVPRLPRTQGAVIAVVAGSLFIRGDSNGDGGIDISDPIHTLEGLFTGAAEIRCDAASDANHDDQVDIADAVRLLDFLFLGGPAPAPPHPGCGADHTGDLDCELYTACR